MRAASIGSSVICLSLCLAAMPAAAEKAQAGARDVAPVPSGAAQAAVAAAVSRPKAVVAPAPSCRADSDCSRQERLLLLLGILLQGRKL
jgi:hypothetical protein